MAFVKLDCGMLRSTTWFDKPARDLIITALLLAEPREFSDPVPQLEASSLNTTGWAAPPGWYGYVPASGPGLAHTANVPWEDAARALDRLGAPEPESRSQEFDGRRMVRVDGGYLILNFQKYRDKDHTTAARSRRYRSRKSDTAAARHTVTGRDITQAEAEAYKEIPLSPPRGKPPKWTVVPPSWQPQPSHRSLVPSWSDARFALEVQKFRDWEFKDPKSDADRCFNRWLRTANERSFSKSASAQSSNNDDGEWA